MARTTATALVDSTKRSERLARILDIIAMNGRATIEELTAGLGTSPATIRRDLGVLAERRLVVRTHGGATAAENAAEIPVTLRDLKRADAKQRIAREAASRIPRERLAIGVSGGTTTAEFILALAGHRGLTIVTNSLSIAALAAENPNLRVVVTGGTLRSQSLEMVGTLAERAMASINLAVAVLGADGVTAADGITTYDETEARANSLMLSRAQRKLVLADGSKIGKTALARIAGMDAFDTLVTDSTADEEQLELIRYSGVEAVAVPLLADS